MRELRLPGCSSLSVVRRNGIRKNMPDQKILPGAEEGRAENSFAFTGLVSENRFIVKEVGGLKLAVGIGFPTGNK